ncbi:glycoside hydrolase family 16 protein [Acholeplasma vituli]|uniref:Glycoside hydrolase family 16 protein n=1 Tax=Paracholeplasma vituli TaxID=69473 RepID=A0ABT2PV56_9MOLU|nr:glycoside hydrolase family 16 protein [Paracholeplasma vituli]MCU0104834.1 glycoside hydrolase family 16 protein [Paracholeplasma vituli]
MAYKLLWQDLFEKDGKPDASIWGYETGGHGFGNGESQYYTNREKNAFVKDGILNIVGYKEKYENNEYTSAKLTTYGKKSILFGRVEVMAKLPLGLGTWPAIWLLSNAFQTGTSWPLCGEIDLMEHVGNHPGFVHFSLHSKSYNHINYLQPTHIVEDPKLTEGFHEYAFEWEEDEMRFYIDKKHHVTFHRGDENRLTDEGGWPFHQPFYLILNLALGGWWGGKIDDSIFPVTMQFKYVKVYERI